MVGLTLEDQSSSTSALIGALGYGLCRVVRRGVEGEPSWSLFDSPSKLWNCSLGEFGPDMCTSGTAGWALYRNGTWERVNLGEVGQVDTYIVAWEVLLGP